MRKYGVVAVLGLLMAVALVVFFLTYHVPTISQLTFTERVQGMDIKPFHDEVDDVYYLFLPAYASKEQVDITMPDDVSVRFSAKGQDYGSTLACLPLQEPVELSISAPHYPPKKCTVEIMQSKNIPTLFIETGEGGLASIRLNKANKTRAAVMAVEADGVIDYSGMCTFSGRGNGTFYRDKMPFNLKFSQEVSLVAAADSSNRWCLLANYVDDSQIRNSICYYMARKVGIPYTSKIVFVSVYVNGEYQGLYNVATKQDYVADAGEKIKAVFEETAWFRIYDKVSDNNFHIRTRYGDAETVVNAVNTFERMLYSDTVSYQQLDQYVDLHSLARKCFIDMVCANFDIDLSQYYMLDDKGRISPICAWDYDLSNGVTWYYPDFGYNQTKLGQPWYDSLFEHNEFREELLGILAQYTTLLHEDILAYEDSICQSVESDWQLNSRRWQHFTPYRDYGTHLKGNDYDFNTLQGHRAYIDSFRTKRLQFLAEYWKAPELFHKIKFTFGAGGVGKMSAVLRYQQGDTLTEDKLLGGLMTMPHEGFKGFYTADGTALTDVKIITDDMEFVEEYDEGYDARKQMVKHYVDKAADILLVMLVFGGLALWLFVKAVLIPIKEARG